MKKSKIILFTALISVFVTATAFVANDVVQGKKLYNEYGTGFISSVEYPEGDSKCVIKLHNALNNVDDFTITVETTNGEAIRFMRRHTDLVAKFVNNVKISSKDVQFAVRNVIPDMATRVRVSKDIHNLARDYNLMSGGQ